MVFLPRACGDGVWPVRDLLRTWGRRTWVRRSVVWVFGPLAVFALMVVLVDDLIMPLWTRHGSEFPAPELVGMSLRSAQSVVEDIGSAMQVAERRFSAENPGGTILEQRPPAGAPIKKGRVFSVVISRGSELIDVPHVRGYTPRQAELILLQAGLTPGGRGSEIDDSIPIGTVVRTIPSAGSSLARGSVVNLMVNERGEGGTAYCPNLVGLNIEEAREILRNRALLLGGIDRKYDKTLLPGTIISQSYSPGEELPQGTEIDLVISRDW